MDIGKALKEGRLRNGLTQLAVEEATGISSKAISSYESNRHTPPFETLLKLCEFYKIDALELLGIEVAGQVSKIPVLSDERIYKDRREVLVADNPIDFEFEEINEAERINYFFVRLSNDDLSDFRILSGDMMLVKTTQSPVDGNLVAVLHENKIIIRKFKRLSEGSYSLFKNEFGGPDIVCSVDNQEESAKTELLGVVKKQIIRR